MFEKTRLCLDKIEESGLINWMHDKELFNSFVVALYDEMNIYWLTRALKTLSDEDVPSEFRLAILKDLREKSIFD